MQGIILDGSLWAALPLALLAGLVSFLSPCILPLVPGYLGFVSGFAAKRSRMVLGSVLFAAGLRRGARAWVQAVCGGAVIVVLAAAWMAASRM